MRKVCDASMIRRTSFVSNWKRPFSATYEMIPELVDGAKMPTAADLPEPLQRLTRRNAMELTHARFRSDVSALIGTLKSIVPSALTRVYEPSPSAPMHIHDFSPSGTKLTKPFKKHVRDAILVLVSSGAAVFAWYRLSLR